MPRNPTQPICPTAGCRVLGSLRTPDLLRGRSCWDTHDLRRSPLFSLLPTAVQSAELWKGHETKECVRAPNGDCAPALALPHIPAGMACGAA